MTDVNQNNLNDLHHDLQHQIKHTVDDMRQIQRTVDAAKDEIFNIKDYCFETTEQIKQLRQAVAQLKNEINTIKASYTPRQRFEMLAKSFDTLLDLEGYTT